MLQRFLVCHDVGHQVLYHRVNRGRQSIAIVGWVVNVYTSDMDKVELHLSLAFL